MKELNKYLKGKGVDVLPQKVLKEKGIDYFYQEPSGGGLYSLKDKYKIESLELIYSKNLINTNMFYHFS